jgi:asparagine synthase (glutamine-hydrolysing)
MSRPQTLLGAWGEPAIALLERAAQRREASLERAGELAVSGTSGASAGRWRAWIAGALTNAPELAAQLGESTGEDRAATRRSSETTNAASASLLARAHARLGAEACGHLRGAFVAVVTDGEQALIARDQLGGRPLLFTRVRGGVLFAEHARDLLELLPSTPGPDRVALMQWIESGTLPPERSFHEGLQRVPAAHRLVLCGQRIAVRRYWRPHYEGTLTDSREAILERLRAEAFAAVERAVAGSRRPALRLSGGLDSACVAAGLAARAAPAGATLAPALALGAAFPEQPETDESELIAATARHTGLTLELITGARRAHALAPALAHIARWRVPPASPNLFVWEPVMAAARGLGVDVMLDGEGGDELFGLAPQLIADRVRRGRLADAWSLAGRIPGMGADPDARMRMRALRRFGLAPLIPDRVRRLRRRGAPARAPWSLLEPADAAAVAELAGSPARGELDGPLWWRGLAEDLTGGDEALDAASHLRREALDGGVGRGHPFMYDVELVRTVLTIPPALQFESLRDRALLRDALAGRIPETVRTRHSKSFFTPLLVEALAAEGGVLARGLAAADAPVRDYVSAAALDRLLAPVATGGATRHARQLWQVGIADTWLRSAEHPDYPGELGEELADRGGR